MKLLVTGSSGHLGEALMRHLPGLGHHVVGLDRAPGPYTATVGCITDKAVVADALAVSGAEAVLHTATLHKPHVASQSRQAFVDVNVTGTLTLLEAARAAGLRRFVFTSTTSAFGDAMRPAPDQPAVWIDETVTPRPRNIYGVTKTAAEDVCALFARNEGVDCVVLRTSRFFPEADDNAETRALYPGDNAKANEFLYRRVDLEDVVMAHLAALEAPLSARFSRYIISAATPFDRSDLAALRRDAAAAARARFPDLEGIYAEAGYRMFPSLDRVYDSAAARAELGWTPVWDFERVLGQIARGEPVGSALAHRVGVKGYAGSGYGDGEFPEAEGAGAPVDATRDG